MARTEQPQEAKAVTKPFSIPGPGLFVCGQVVRRTRKLIGEKQDLVITYFINTGTAIYPVQQWRPKDGDLPYDLGSLVSLPVSASARENRFNLSLLQDSESF